jgi:hypothetical protein
MNLLQKKREGTACLQSKTVLLNYLKKQIDLKNSSTECQINNNSAVEKGKSYSQSLSAGGSADQSRYKQRISVRVIVKIIILLVTEEGKMDITKKY